MATDTGMKKLANCERFLSASAYIAGMLSNVQHDDLTPPQHWCGMAVAEQSDTLGLDSIPARCYVWLRTHTLANLWELMPFLTERLML